MTDVAKAAPRRSRLVESLLIAFIAVPVLGILMGGVFSVPAFKLTNEREPGLSLFLGAALAVTVFGIGFLLRAPLGYLVGAWAFSLVLLVLARLAYGSLGHSLERFGMVHMATLLAVVLVAVAAHVRARSGHATP